MMGHWMLHAHPLAHIQEQPIPEGSLNWVLEYYTAILFLVLGSSYRYLYLKVYTLSPGSIYSEVGLRPVGNLKHSSLNLLGGSWGAYS